MPPCLRSAPLTVLSLGPQAGRHALEGQKDVGKAGSIAHQRGPRTSETAGGTHATMALWPGCHKKWHFLARFWRVPVSESQVKKRVRTSQERGRYTSYPRYARNGRGKWHKAPSFLSATDNRRLTTDNGRDGHRGLLPRDEPRARTLPMFPILIYGGLRIS
jgi:hypothetical protein